jgi:hypothetical protein
MTAAQQTADPGEAAPKAQKMIGEWFWRFLALIMVLTVGWVLWIIYQINPQPLITNAGFEAAAKARASQDAKGKITQVATPVAAAPGAAPSAGDSSAQLASAQAEAVKPPATPAEAKAPPVNVERLRFADSIETPIPERGKKQ